MHITFPCDAIPFDILDQVSLLWSKTLPSTGQEPILCPGGRTHDGHAQSSVRQGDHVVEWLDIYHFLTELTARETSTRKSHNIDLNRKYKDYVYGKC